MKCEFCEGDMKQKDKGTFACSECEMTISECE